MENALSLLFISPFLRSGFGRILVPSSLLPSFLSPAFCKADPSLPPSHGTEGRGEGREKENSAEENFFAPSLPPSLPPCLVHVRREECGVFFWVTDSPIEKRDIPNN